MYFVRRPTSDPLQCTAEIQAAHRPCAMRRRIGPGVPLGPATSYEVRATSVEVDPIRYAHCPHRTAPNQEPRCPTTTVPSATATTSASPAPRPSAAATSPTMRSEERRV